MRTCTSPGPGSGLTTSRSASSQPCPSAVGAYCHCRMVAVWAAALIGWILGSRAAADAYRIELKRREERARREAIRQAS